MELNLSEGPSTVKKGSSKKRHLNRLQQKRAKSKLQRPNGGARSFKKSVRDNNDNDNWSSFERLTAVPKQTDQQQQIPKAAETKTDTKRLQPKAASSNHTKHSAAASNPHPSPNVTTKKDFPLPLKPSNITNGDHSPQKTPAELRFPRDATRDAGKKHHTTNGGGGPPLRSRDPKDGVVSSLFTKNPLIPEVKAKSSRKPAEEDGATTVFAQGETAEFNSVHLDKKMVANLTEHMKLSQLTVVQRQVIPRILEGKDLLVKSATGTGKTLAYAIPVTELMQRMRPTISRKDGPLTVVLLPTRELALQTMDVFTQLLRPFIRIVPGTLMGGEKKKAEKARLRKGVNILIATPGRLADHIENSECLTLSNVRWLILDEADRLTDKGFEEEITKILKALEKTDKTRQNVLLSATLTTREQELAKMSLKTPETIDVTKLTGDEAEPEKSKDGEDQDEDDAMEDEEGEKKESKRKKKKKTNNEEENEFKLPSSLKQHFVILPCKLRLVGLVAFLRSKVAHVDNAKAVVFVFSRAEVAFLQQLLCDHKNLDLLDGDIPLHFLHGGQKQRERTEVFFKFCKSKNGILFCTDVAARGLHLPKVTWIVQYTVPASVPEYIHRVGRTARLDSGGEAVIFLMPHEASFAETLAEQSGCTLEPITMDDLIGSLVPMIRSKRGELMTEQQIAQGRVVATDIQMGIEREILDDQQLRTAAVNGFNGYTRSYAAYPSDMKQLFNIRNLHLGHTAKSFGLRDTPGDVSKSQMTNQQKQQAANDKKRKMQFDQNREAAAKQKKRADVGEFEGGGTSGPRTKKKKKKKGKK